MEILQQEDGGGYETLCLEEGLQCQERVVEPAPGVKLTVKGVFAEEAQHGRKERPGPLQAQGSQVLSGSCREALQGIYQPVPLFLGRPLLHGHPGDVRQSGILLQQMGEGTQTFFNDTIGPHGE